MQYIFRNLSCLVIGSFICLFVHAQNKKTFSGDFHGMKLEQFAQAVESQSDYRFYFKSSETDSIVLDFSVQDQTLPSILNMVLAHTDFHFAIDDDKNVFITEKFTIQPNLPDDFFINKRSVSDSAREYSFSVDNYLDNQKNQKLRASLENRVFVIGPKTNTYRTGKGTVAGYVRDAKTGETLVGATVSLDNPPVGVSTDQFGYFSLTIPLGPHVLHISSIGMKETVRHVALYSDGKLNIEMEQFIPGLKAVTITSEKNSNTGRLQMGVDRLNIKTIRQMPVVFGEADILRAVLTLPGVTSVGEASTGFNVRGGSADQNLVLFNNSTIYNPSHFFGFFSSFNPDVVKGVELYKSSIPEKYGGRLSSVLDVTTRDGNSKKISGAGGIGPLDARLTIEGPLFSEKTTFLIAGRSTYSDWLLKEIPNVAYQNSTAGFYDANLRLTHEINAKNHLFLTGYISSDRFTLNSDTLYKYQNKNVNLQWKHEFNNRFNAVFMAGIDDYNYSITSTLNPINAYKLSFKITQYNFHGDFTYNLNSVHTLDFGVSSIYYKLYPGSLDPQGSKSLVVPDHVPTEQALESAVYLGDRINLGTKFSVNLGIRYSYYNYLGPQNIYTYAPGQPLETTTIIDSTYYGPGKNIKTYQYPDYRVSARYILDDNSSVKISYNSLHQFIHQLTNTTAISPTDIWKLSGPHIQPQNGQQLSLGYYRDFKSHTIETSVEIYYKKIDEYLDYKSGASLVLNHHIETDVLTTRGKAYGAEFLIKKTSGKLNGWLSYTYSRTFLQQDDPNAGQLINNGAYYPANYDRPSILNFIGNYQLNHRFSVSVNVNYSTGRPITLPTAIYDLGGGERVYYSERNAYRIPDYFRMDLSVNIEGNHKIKKFKHSSWSIGVYNLTGQNNPYSIYFTEENGVIKGYKLSIFGSPVPSITYNFKF
jgi:CarboxypepD_reg-like domain/TonB-dependent Receptor Plug Domain